MKKYSILSVIALATAIVTLNAQEGGRAGRAAASITNVPAPTSPVTGNASAGKALYSTYGCYACHGFNGETGARAFVGRWGNLSTEQNFLTFLRGRANVAPLAPSTSTSGARSTPRCSATKPGSARSSSICW